MKISRRQLRRLIETTIKPKNPLDYIDDESHIEKIQPLIDSGDESFVRTGYTLATNAQKIKPDVYQPDPEKFTHLDLGYEGEDYPGDFRRYKEAGRQTTDTPLIRLAPSNPDDHYNTRVEGVIIPIKLVDELIKRYKRVIELEAQGIAPYNMGRDAHAFRNAALDVYSHIDDYLDNKYGGSYQLDTYGYEGASGYRGEEYNRAMEHFGEYA